MNMVIVFAKYPQLGKVKTRLAVEVGAELATALYHHFIKLTVALVSQVTNARPWLAVSPQSRKKHFENEYLPSGWQLLIQRGPDLGSRLIHAFHAGFERGAQNVLIIGSDSPTLPGSYLDEAFDQLENTDVVIGPASDGGYYLIALKEPHDALFSGIHWGMPQVLQQTLKVAKECGLAVHLLPQWYDVDDLAGLRQAAGDDGSGILSATMLNAGF